MSCANGCTLVRRIRHHGPRAFLAVLALAALPGSVSADFINAAFVDWNGDGTAAPGSFQSPGYNHQEKQNRPGTTNSYTDSLTVQNLPTAQGWSGLAVVTGTAELGHLEASVQTQAVWNGRGGVFPYAEGSVDVGFNDVFTVPATAKPEDDALVHLPFTASFTDTMSLSANPFVTPTGAVKGSGEVTMDISADASGSGVAIMHVTNGNSSPITGGYEIEDDDDHGPAKGHKTLSGYMGVTPGTTFSVRVQFIAVGLANAGNILGYSSTSSHLDVEASHSGNFDLDPDPITGASYTTLSGHSYFTPQVSATPEPASLTLAGIAIGLAAGYRWRHRPSPTLRD